MRFEQAESKAMRRPIRTRQIVGMAALIALGACGSDSVLDPRFEPEVTNATDNFQFQSTAVSHITETLAYNWHNSGTTANVDLSGHITGGNATLQVRDADGGIVFASGLAATGSFTSNAGTPGTWKIQILLQDASGTLNFRVQKP